MSLVALGAPVISSGGGRDEADREAFDKTRLARRVAQHLGIGATRLALLLKVEPFEAGRLLAGQGHIEVGTREFRNALRLVRLTAALNALYEDDREGAVAWLDAFDPEFGSPPWTLMVASEDGFEEAVEVATARAASPSPSIRQ